MERHCADKGLWSDTGKGKVRRRQLRGTGAKERKLRKNAVKGRGGGDCLLPPEHLANERVVRSLQAKLTCQVFWKHFLENWVCFSSVTSFQLLFH